LRLVALVLLISNSALNKTIPLIVKNIAAASGLANSSLSLCSKRRPVIATGIVPNIKSQASFSNLVFALPLFILEKKPPAIFIHSLR
jgi:hypothetical protein